MADLRSAARSTVSDGWLLVAVSVMVLAELVLRLTLASETHIFLMALLPPLVIVVGAGLLFASTRSGHTDPTLRLLGQLAVLAVAGHAVALILGTSLFVAVDTPVRAVLYAFGYELLATPGVAVGLPLWGLATGITVAWVLPALAVVGLVRTNSLSSGVRYAFLACGYEPPRVAGIAAAHLLVGVAVGVGGAFGYFFGVKTESVQLFVLGGGTLAVSLMIVPLAVLLTSHWQLCQILCSDLDFESSSHQWRSLFAGVPVGNAFLVIVIVVALAVPAGLARTTETRPTGHAEPLGDDPNEMYRTAFNNTFEQSHTAVAISPDSNETVYEWHYDHQSRRLSIPTDSEEYASTATVAAEPTLYTTGSVQGPWLRDLVLSEWNSGGFTTQTPGYTPILTDVYDGPWFFERHQALGTGWERRESGQQILLETTDPSDVARFEGYEGVNRSEEAWVRVWIDPETRTLDAVEVRFKGVFDHPDLTETNYTRRYEFEVGTDVQRPDELGSLTLEERAWKLLVY